MDINQIRRQNLNRLVAQYRSQAAMAREVSMSPQVLSGLLTGTKPFGEKSARSIERALHLELGWLDSNGGNEERPNVVGLDSDTIRLAQRIQALTPRDRVIVEALIGTLEAR